MNERNSNDFCTQCGAKLSDARSNYCDSCGAVIESQAKSTISNQNSQPKAVESTHTNTSTDSRREAISEKHSVPSPVVPEESLSQFEPIKFCPECGKKLPFERVKFCPYCGTKIPPVS